MVLEIPLPESFGPGCFWSFRFSSALFNGNAHREKTRVYDGDDDAGAAVLSLSLVAL